VRDLVSRMKCKAGVLGLGKVGKNLLLRQIHGSDHFRIHWVSDSKRVYRVNRQSGFTGQDCKKIIKFKQTHTAFPEIPKCEIYEFENVSQQTKLLNDLITTDKKDWVIFDTTFTRKEDDYSIANTMMGCKAYCAGNKTAWTDYDSCDKLFRKATETQTLLGLNCTVGVWLDQMEILPIMLQNLISGKIILLKRDNSSLNLFFEKIGSGLTVEKTILELENSGHLDLPGPDALLTEVKDQTMKAHIAANVCGIMRSTRPVFKNQQATRPDEPKSFEAKELAEWHLRGRKHGDYPALVSEINVDTSDGMIDLEVGFAELKRGQPLARDFVGKCAMSIDASAAKFKWSKGTRKPAQFMRSGYGGAKKTAAKLIAEANRAIIISHRKPKVCRSPILVLAALEKGEQAAKLLDRKLRLAL